MPLAEKTRRNPPIGRDRTQSRLLIGQNADQQIPETSGDFLMYPNISGWVMVMACSGPRQQVRNAGISLDDTEPAHWLDGRI